MRTKGKTSVKGPLEVEKKDEWSTLSIYYFEYKCCGIFDDNMISVASVRTGQMKRCWAISDFGTIVLKDMTD